MTVKTEIIQVEKSNIVDDLNNEIIDQNKLAELKKRIAAKNKEKEPVQIDLNKRAIKFGTIGLGQCGSKLASAFYRLGQDGVAINTAASDLSLLDLPETNKLHLNSGIDGAARNRDRGAEIATNFREEIKQFIQKQLNEVQVFLLTSSLGGGSGSGAAPVVVDILVELGKPILAMFVLPLQSEDGLTQANSFQALSEMAGLLKNNKIANILVVDNAKIESIFSSVSQMEFYDVANSHIATTFDQMNKLSARPSSVKSVDPSELIRVLLDSQGLSVIGNISLENYGTNGEESETKIAEACIANLDNNLFVSGFDLSNTKYSAFYVCCNKNTWSKIPSSSINYALAVLGDDCKMATIYRGLYEENLLDGTISIYTIFSGLGLPEQRVESLKKQAEQYHTVVKTKETNRNINLSINTGQDQTLSKVQEIKNKIAKGNSTLGNFMKQNTIDRRNK